VVSIPVVLNGGIFSAEDVLRAFSETNADGVMIARGAIEHPWIFREAKELMTSGEIKNTLSINERIYTALKHLKYELELSEDKRVIIPFRKYYAGYLKGLPNNKDVRQELYKHLDYAPIEETLLKYLEHLIRT
jgi:tRNA-dihydrouridine synthase B